MALRMRIELPFGRYAATPWGTHVNEGKVEWPPSPWRIVRALYASWRVHHPDIPAEDVRSALELLCRPPRYGIPRHTTSVTRHYLPDSGDRSTKRSTGLALQAQVVVAPGDALDVEWATGGGPTELDVLQRLASTVTYLGRAGSRVAITIEERDPDPAELLGPSDLDGVDSDDVLDLLVPTVPLDLATLTTTTGELYKRGRSIPERAHFVSYRVPPSEGSAQLRSERPVPRPVEVVQFVVAGRGRPTMADVALLGTLFRRAVTSRAVDDPSLQGHVGDTGPSDHRHAHYLAINDLRCGGRVDRLIVWVPAGMTSRSASRIATLTSLTVPEHLAKRLGTKIDLGIEYVGPACGLDDRLTGPARTWRTLTPFTTPRHRKRRQSWEEFVSSTVRRDLAHHGLASDPDRVEIAYVPDDEVSPVGLRARTVHRSRSLGRSRQQAGFHVQLTFREPLTGPLALGALAHFGLGTMVVAGDR